jgi:hypothetical protein
MVVVAISIPLILIYYPFGPYINYSSFISAHITFESAGASCVVHLEGIVNFLAYYIMYRSAGHEKAKTTANDEIDERELFDSERDSDPHGRQLRTEIAEHVWYCDDVQIAAFRCPPKHMLGGDGDPHIRLGRWNGLACRHRLAFTLVLEFGGDPTDTTIFSAGP